MSKIEIEEWTDKIISGELPDIAYFTEEQKEHIKHFIYGAIKAFEKITDFHVNNLIPIIRDALEKNSCGLKKIRYIAVRKQEIKPLYIDKRRNIHICSRSNC